MNDATGDIIYTPPVGESVLLEYMKNLENYINDAEVHPIDPLVKLAIIHYQFESIHPFYDGNGRTGRIMNILYLVLSELLDSPILYLSQYIVRNKQDYYFYLQSIRNTGDWGGFVEFMLIGIKETSDATLKIIKDINALFENITNKIKYELPAIYSKEMVELLFYEFYTKIGYIVDGLHITRKTAAIYLNALERIGVLKSEKIGREKIYKNVGLFDLIRALGV